MLSLVLGFTMSTAASAQQFPLGVSVGGGIPLTDPLDDAQQPIVGDYNGDGHLDALVRTINTNGLHLLTGDGQGGFAEPSRIAGLNFIAMGTASADLDGDGDEDIVASVRSNGGAPAASIAS